MVYTATTRCSINFAVMHGIPAVSLGAPAPELLVVDVGIAGLSRGLLQYGLHRFLPSQASCSPKLEHRQQNFFATI
jgi:hypothetical protein